MKIIEVCSEIGAGTRGSGLGPDAIRVASLNAGSPFFANHTVERVADRNDLLYQPETTPRARRIKGIVEVYENVCKAVSDTLANGQFPLVIAGDHSSAGGTIAGIKQARPNERMGVIWIDAHADLHSPYTSPSGNVHGMPLAASINTDNLDKKRWQVPQETADHWNALKNLGGHAPKLKPGDIGFVALRDTEPEEDHLVEVHNMPVVKVEKLRRTGAEAIAEEMLERLSACDHIYVSFDVDSLDISISQGTGTPVDQGLFENEAAVLLETLVASGRVSCLEVVEVNPCLDNQRNAMAETAFRIIERVAAKVTANE